MELGSLFLILALALLVGMFLSQPFMKIKDSEKLVQERKSADQEDHLRSMLLAENERVLTALQELDFDHSLGKIPSEDYPVERTALLKHGADVLRQLDELQPANGGKASPEQRIESAVAARRADATRAGAVNAVAEMDELELAILARRRQKQEKMKGFCPECGKPVAKTDLFCARCGKHLQESD
ncbi:MAG: zinc ribbon domain-containing protein [Chloroflexota bacterium]|jgi:rRNA maturation endonuclease Nob1